MYKNKENLQKPNFTLLKVCNSKVNYATYGLSLDDSRVYKLAMLASDAVQPIGSGGDIAASAVTGWVDYASPNRV